MAQIVIDLPDSVDDIPRAVEHLRKQLAAVNAQRDALLGALRSIQNNCKHPNAVHSRDYDGGTSTRCPTCGYTD